MLRNMTSAIGAVILAVLGGLAVSAPALGGEAAIEKGKELAFDRKKGNCLACHMIDDGDLAGNVGPPLLAMKARYPERSELRSQIWDATVANPRTTMPPFGKHGILTDEEIDLITDYIYTL
jgi:sulfur-oxidizing protein SoxX